MGQAVRAAVLRGIGEPSSVEEIDLVECEPHQVRVKLAATGVCHSDLSVKEGNIPFLFPTVLGHEGAGVVVEIGSSVSRVSPGDHVVLTWMAPCRACAWCLGGEPYLCEQNITESVMSPFASVKGESLLRGLGIGAFSEETVVSERSVVRIDPSLPLESAALLGCAVATGVGAVWNTARIEPGSTIAVVGCGGVGLCAVAGARLAGASLVVAVDRVAVKLSAAVAHGATDVVDAASDDPVAAVRSMTGGRGCDYVFEVVGRSSTIRQAYAMTRRGGTVVMVGAGSPSDEVVFPAMDLFADAKTLVGCVYGSCDPERDLPVLADLSVQGRLDLASLVTRRIGLEEIDDAFDEMASGTTIRSMVIFD